MSSDMLEITPTVIAEVDASGVESIEEAFTEVYARLKAVKAFEEFSDLQITYFCISWLAVQAHSNLIFMRREIADAYKMLHYSHYYRNIMAMLDKKQPK